MLEPIFRMPTKSTVKMGKVLLMGFTKLVTFPERKVFKLEIKLRDLHNLKR